MPAASTGRKRWQTQERPAGPVALLLQAIGIAGLTMDADGHVWGPFGSLCVVDAPIHLYRQIIGEAAQNGIIQALRLRRPSIAPTEGIDWSLTRPFWKPTLTADGNPRSQRHMLGFAAGGHRRQHRLTAAAGGPHEPCLVCGKGRDDDGHLWECEGLRHVRAKHPMIQKFSTYPATPFKHYGVVPHVCTDPPAGFLGRSGTREP